MERGRRAGSAGTRAAWAAVLTAALAACGGGGGGGSNAPAPPPSAGGFSVGGTVSGLDAGASVTLTSNGRSVTANANGAFTLGSDVAAGSTYSVSARTTAKEKRCIVDGGRGTVSSNVTQIAVDCGLGMPWATDGAVLASALSGDGRTLYIGGGFTRLAPSTGSFVRTDPATGSLLEVPQPVLADVVSAISDGEGGAYISLRRRQLLPGESQSARYTMRRLDASGAQTGFALSGFESRGLIGAEGFAFGPMLRSGNVVFAGGPFLLPGSVEYQGVAAVNATTGALLPWRTSGAPNGVFELAAAGNTLFATTWVAGPGEAARPTLTAIDMQTGAVRDWAPMFGPIQGDAWKLKIAVSGQTLVVAGPFTAVNGSARSGLAAFDTATLALRDWNPEPSADEATATVSAIAATADAVYLSGRFNRIGNADRNNLAALSTATGEALPWQAPADSGEIRQMIVHGDQLIVAGGFRAIGGQPRRGLAALSLADGSVRDYGAGQDIDWPDYVVGGGSRLWVGGRFAVAGGVRRDGLAAIDTRTGKPLDWNPSLQASEGEPREVQHLALTPAGLVAAGSFNVAGSRRDIAAFDPITGQAKSWDAQLPQFPHLRQLLLQGSSLYVVGGFSSWGGQARPGVVRLDADTLALQPFVPELTASFGAHRLAVTPERIYLAGGTQGAAAFDVQTGARLPWTPTAINTGPDLPTTVSDIAVLNGSVYIVGQDLVVPGTNALVSAARVDAVTGASTTWPSAAGSGVRSYGGSARLFLLEGRLLVSGCSIDIHLTPSCVLSEKTPDTGADLGTLLSADGTIETVSMDAWSLYVGGQFGGDGNSRLGLWFLAR